MVKIVSVSAADKKHQKHGAVSDITVSSRPVSCKCPVHSRLSAGRAGAGRGTDRRLSRHLQGGSGNNKMGIKKSLHPQTKWACFPLSVSLCHLFLVLLFRLFKKSFFFFFFFWLAKAQRSKEEKKTLLLLSLSIYFFFFSSRP